MNNGTLLYSGIASPASSPSWQTFVAHIVVPANAVSATVFHVLPGVGQLAVDDYSLTVDSSDQFAQGMVSLTFDDGWLSQYTIGKPILDAAGLKGTFFINSNPMLNAGVNNRVANPSLEATDGAGLPLSWNKGVSGVNNAVFTYPAPGFGGGSAARIDITNYTSGDAKWYMDEEQFRAGDDREHVFSDQSMGTATSTVQVRVTMTNGTVSFATLATLGPSATWRKFQKILSLPAGNVASITVFHYISGVGSLTIDDASIENLGDFMNTAQVLDLQADGQEIGVHTRNHAHLTTLTPAQLTSEISGGRSDLLAVGVTPANTFAYPYGEYNPQVIQAVKDAGIVAARSTNDGYNTKSTSHYELAMQQVDASTTPAQITAWIDTAIASKTWLILMYHQESEVRVDLAVTPEDLQAVVDVLVAKAVPVVTMSQGVAQMNP